MRRNVVYICFDQIVIYILILVIQEVLFLPQQCVFLVKELLHFCNGTRFVGSACEWRFTCGVKEGKLGVWKHNLEKIR